MLAAWPGRHGLAGHQETLGGSASGHDRADPVDLRLAPDKIGGLSTVALSFVGLRGACHGRKA
jgi:hypothetical protein